MSKYKIAWLPGDGIGSEVLNAARTVLDASGFEADYIHGDIGWEFWKKEGDPLPERTKELLKECDAAMFGANTSKPAKEAENELYNELKGKGLVYRSPIVKIRQEFDLYTYLRPSKAYPGNPSNIKDNIDIVIVRENTEDLYSGVEFFPVPDKLKNALAEYSEQFGKFASMKGGDFAVSCKINSVKGSERIIRKAFEYAKTFGRKKVTVVHKANVVRASDGLFLDIASDISREYPEIEFDKANIDALAMWLIKNPTRFDVLVSPNLYGGIVSDLCAQMVGGLGFACSGNIGDDLGVFEPAHGSAPKYKGQNKVNPIAAILAAKMMLEWLGEIQKAEKIENSVARIIREGYIRTYDMGGTHGTLEMAEEIAKNL